ncbi:unnamed protein product [Parnassius apollo]|uniref:(apollo) hypothetical protein n=1 Tax=Parnassius apollo TaxID=110799 RepID=A0A8S3Y4P4_PARAO|nr:unnamed protein product [Parnassius apollo]
MEKQSNETASQKAKPKKRKSIKDIDFADAGPSVSSLMNILDTEQLSDDPPIQVTNEYMSQEKSGDPPIQVTNEYMETQEKSGDPPTQVTNEHMETHEEWRQEAYVSERDIEIQECLDEI